MTPNNLVQISPAEITLKDIPYRHRDGNPVNRRFVSLDYPLDALVSLAVSNRSGHVVAMTASAAKTSTNEMSPEIKRSSGR